MNPKIVITALALTNVATLSALRRIRKQRNKVVVQSAITNAKQTLQLAYLADVCYKNDVQIDDFDQIMLTNLFNLES
jgi:hypothetical protein